MAIIVSEGERGNNPRIIAEYYDFHRKCSIPTINAAIWINTNLIHGYLWLDGYEYSWGFTPVAMALPNRYYLIIALRAVVVRSDRHWPSSAYLCCILAKGSLPMKDTFKSDHDR